MPWSRRRRVRTHAEARAALPARVAREALGRSIASGTTSRRFPCARPQPDVAVETRGAARAGFYFSNAPGCCSTRLHLKLASRSANRRTWAAVLDEITIQGTSFTLAAVTNAHSSCTARSKARKNGLFMVVFAETGSRRGQQNTQTALARAPDRCTC